ncbi:putative D-xylose 1-dehydrogenase [Spathaspora sp. JA1]|nr:putative D-xylose 1-dehydrogenase [Spathaspora sp. JA1]
MSITLRWGILGAGNISSQFVHDLLLNNERDTDFHHIVGSIGCSNKQKGLDFISENNIKSRNNYDVVPEVQSYQDLYDNPNIDIVYIGTPHTCHKEQAIGCLNGNKHVLCEKPMTVNKKEAEELFALAKSKKKFFMEAVWTRFFPAIKALKKMVYEENVIGEVHRMFADFSYCADVSNLPTSSRVRDRKLAAGALLDIGIYPLTYSRILLDDKVGEEHTKFEVKSFMTLDPVDKVDHLSSIIIKYENGKHAILTTSELVNGPKAYIRLEGSEGYLEMYSDNPARPKHFKTFYKDGRGNIVYKDESGYNGFIYEANAIAEDIKNARLENSTMPHAETLLVMGVMDQIRKENGLVYDQDI